MSQPLFETVDCLSVRSADFPDEIDDHSYRLSSTTFAFDLIAISCNLMHANATNDEQ